MANIAKIKINGQWVAIPAIKGDKGDPGIYVGSDVPAAGNNIWVDPNGDANATIPIVTEVPEAFVPNVYYQLGEQSELSITLADPTETTMLNEYMIEFISGAAATDFSYDVTAITFVAEPTIEANMLYQISIVNGLAVMAGVAYTSETDEETEEATE